MGGIKDKIDTNERAKYAYKYYLNLGWTPAQSSAIVGNLIRESGFDTNAVGDNNQALGIAQWHKDRVEKAKKLYGDNWKTLDNQLAFVDWELNNTEKEAGDALRNTKGVWQAGQVFTDKYERPKVKFYADDTRQQHVADTFNKYGGLELSEADKKMFNGDVTYANSVAPYIHQTSEVSNLPNSQTNSNLADEEEEVDNTTEEQDENVQEAQQKIQQKQNEFSFIQDLVKASQVQYVEPDQVQEEQPTEENYFQDGGQLDMYGNTVNAKIQNTNIPRSMYDRRTGVIKLGTDYQGMSEQDKAKVIAHENRHDWQYKNNRGNFEITHNPEYAFNEMLQKPPVMTSTDEIYNNYNNRQQKETDIQLNNLKNNNPQFLFVPNQIMYNKGFADDLYDNKFSLEGEAQYYQNTGQKSFQDGGRFRHNTELMVKQAIAEQKDKEELHSTGTIRNPRSIAFQDSAQNLKNKQTTVSQDKLTPKQREEYSNAMEKVNKEPLKIGDRPLIYLANPSKILGDLGVRGFDTSEEDRQKININRYNPAQSGYEGFKNNLAMGLNYVPEAGLNLAMGAAFAPESAGMRGILNETLNPLAGIKNYSTNIIEDEVPSYGFKEKAKQFFKGRAIVPPTKSLPISSLDNIVDQQMRYLDSEGYLQNRINNTGETKEQVLKEINNYKKNFESTNIYLDDTASGNHRGFYSPGFKLLNMKPNIGIASGEGITEQEIEGALMHETGHALSPNNPKKYKNYPLLNVEESLKDRKYQMLPEEQQVRFNKMKFFMEDNYGKEAGTKFSDSDIEKLLNTDSRFPTLHGNKKYKDAYDFVNDTKYAEQKVNYKEALKNALNKSWGVAPIIGASYLSTQPEQQKFQEGGTYTDNEKAFLEELKGLPIHKDGVFASRDKPVIVPSNQITMLGVPYQIHATSLETGEQKILQPNKNYNFKNTKHVLEVPIKK